jgi:hypothetical protein
MENGKIPIPLSFVILLLKDYGFDLKLDIEPASLVHAEETLIEPKTDPIPF